MAVENAVSFTNEKFKSMANFLSSVSEISWRVTTVPHDEAPRKTRRQLGNDEHDCRLRGTATLYRSTPTGRPQFGGIPIIRSAIPLMRLVNAPAAIS
jgi:hypothetical protein